MTRTLAIETGVEPEYESALMEAAREAGWAVLNVRHVPFTTDFVHEANHEPLPQHILNDEGVWLHGSIQAGKGAQAGTKWQVHAPWPALRCSNYYPKLKGRLLQEDHLFVALSEVESQKDTLWDSHLVVDESLFFRPDGNDKVFTGGCVSLDDFDYGYKLMTFYEPPPSTQVVVARPQRIQAEARFLVVGGKLVTGSYYKTGGQALTLEASSSLMEVAREMLSFCLSRGFDPAPSWVLDLAETAEGWSIIEVGASSCCGLYKCDLRAFIQALGEVLEQSP